MEIDRGNSKHGPHLDEQMAQEAQEAKSGARIEEQRVPEPPVEGEPEVTWIPHGHHGVDTGDDRDPDRREQRARIGAHLPRDVFPADRAKLVDRARGNRAPDEVVEVLGRLPSDVTYPDAPSLWEALGLRSDR